MRAASLLRPPGEAAALPVGDRQEGRYDGGGDQLEVVGVDAAEAHHRLDDYVIDDRADGYRQKLQREIGEEFGEQHLADDDGGQADNDSALAHAGVGEGLVLAQKGSGQGHQAVGDHQAQHLAYAGVDALGPGHAGVGPGGPEGRTQLGAEEPIQPADDGRREQAHHEDGVAVEGAGPLGYVLDEAEGNQQLVQIGLVNNVDRYVGLHAHDRQVDGPQPQLGQDAGQNGGNAADGVEQAGDQSRQHPGQNGAQGGDPDVDAVEGQQYAGGLPVAREPSTVRSATSRMR